MPRSHRLLMIGPDHQALEALEALEALSADLELPLGGSAAKAARRGRSLSDRDIDVTVLLGGAGKDIGLPIAGSPRILFTDDAKNIDNALNCLYRHGATDFDAVYAHDDPAVMTAAVLGEVLGARAVSPRVAALFRDKYQQKRALREAGVPVTRTALIEDIRDLPPGYVLPFAKAVIKPVAGQATQVTHVVSTVADVRRVGRECVAKGVTARTFIVEEFVSGQEWFADGIVSDGQIRFVSLGGYPKPCLSAVQERSPIRTFCLDPVTDKAAYDAALPIVTKALSTLGLAYGVFHMELFHDGSQIYFSECAARRAGGPISDQIRHKFGVDLTALSVLAHLEPIDDIVPQVREGVVASAFLPVREGTLLDHPGVADLLAQPDVVNARIFVPKGLRANPMGGNTIGRMGEFTVHTSTVEQASARLDEVSDWFAAHTKLLPFAPTMRELWSLQLGD